MDEPTYPPPRPRNVVLVAAGLSVLALVAGDAYRGEVRATLEHPDRPMPVLADQFAPPPTGAPAQDPGGTGDGLGVTSASPDWLIDLPAGVEVESLAATADGYVVRTREQLIALGPDGEQVWDYPLSELFDQVSVGPEVVLVSHDHPTDDRWPQPYVIVALDSGTGETLWKEDEASFWTAYRDAVYMSVCRGGQNGIIGDCRLTARDPLTNTVRWTISTYASAQVQGGGMQQAPVPPYLMVVSYPTGNASRTVTTIDPDSGRQFGAGFEGHQGTVQAPGTLISIADEDDNPADGCTAELTGYELTSGEQVWQYVSTTSKRSDGVYCDSLPGQGTSDGALAVTSPEGRAEVLDTGTGEVVWTAPEPGGGLAATDEVLVALDRTGESAELVVYDLASNDERWRAPAPPGDADPTTVVVNGTVLTYYRSTWYSADPVGYDLATGDAWAYADPSSYETRWTVGPGWVAVCDEAACRGYDLR